MSLQAARISRFALVLAAFLLCSCAGPVVRTGLLSDYDSFNLSNDPRVKVRLEPQDTRFALRSMSDEFLVDYLEKKEVDASLVDCTEPIRDAQPTLFVVEVPEWKAPIIYDDPKKTEEILFVVRERMVRSLLRSYRKPVIVRYNFLPGDPLLRGYRVVRLKSYVTDACEGFAPTRYLVGYGLGATRIQIEGRILEGEDDTHPIGEYAIRVAHGGFPLGYQNPRVLLSSYCLKYGAEAAIRKFIDVFVPAMPGSRPAPPPGVRVASRS